MSAQPHSFSNNRSAGSTQTLPNPPSQPHRIATEDEALSVAQTLAAHFKEGAAERDRERILPWEQLEQYTASGLGGITVPQAHGGLGASYATLAQVFATLCAADPSLGQIPQNHFALIQNLQDTATPAQQARWFADVLAGHRLGNAGPEKKAKAATVASATARVARDEAGQLRVTGTRFYSTGALYAHWVPFRAVDEQDRFVQVWVRRHAPGVKVIDDWDAFGQRTTASGSVHLDNVAVADDEVVALYEVANPFNLSGPVSQLIQASIDMGIAQGAFDDALQFVREKTRAWGHSGVEHAWQDPYIIQEVGALKVQLDAAHEVLLEAARLLDSFKGQSITEAITAQASVAVARAKILTTEVALEASERLLELAGSASARAAHGFDRHWRNARVHTLHDPVRWKYHLLGHYVLNGQNPRRHQWN